MKMYFLIIGGGLTLIAIINVLLGFVAPLWVLFWVAGLAIACGLIDGVVALTVHLLPKGMFEPHRKAFHVSEKKIKFYKKLGVKKWKEKVPDLGQFANFKKNKIENPFSLKYIHKFLVENCYGDMIHIVSAFMGFLIIFFPPVDLAISIALPVAIINFIINYMPVMIQRYNRPKLLNIYNKLLSQENRLLEDELEEKLKTKNS